MAEGKNDLAIAFGLSIFYCLISFISYILLLPIFPDAIWINENTDATIKSFLIALVPAIAMFLLLYPFKRASVPIGILILIPIFALLILLYSFSKREEDGILLHFTLTFIIPPSITGCLASFSQLMIRTRRNRAC